MSTLPAGAGPYAWAWNGRTSRGTALPAGVYTITQTLTDPYGSHPRTVKTSKVTLSLRKISWSTVTVNAQPGPRCFQFTSGDGVGAYSCGSSGALSLAGSAGHWPGVGYQFQLPSADAYRSIRVEVLGRVLGRSADGRPARLDARVHVGSALSAGLAAHRDLANSEGLVERDFTNPGAYISGRSVRVYVDGGGRLSGAFSVLDHAHPARRIGRESCSSPGCVGARSGRRGRPAADEMRAPRPAARPGCRTSGSAR